MAPSTDALIRLLALLLYVPFGLAAWRRLIPRLSPAAKRLAVGMLAAQVLVILLAAQVQPATKFESWLWDFHEEWNIPATFATLQLAAVGGVALLAAFFAKGQAALLRWYWVGIGLVFIFLAVDEYLALHEVIPDWELRYIALGAIVVAATLAVAWRSGRSDWPWHTCFLAGLALSVAGAMLVNALPIPCGGLGFLRFEGCLEFYFLEESLEFLGIWLTLVALLGQFSAALPGASKKARRLLYALPALALLVIFIYSLTPQLQARLWAQPAALRFRPGIDLRGFQFEHGAGAAVANLYLAAPQADFIDFGVSVHLVDQVSGESIASRDEWIDRQHGFWLFGPDYAPTIRQRLQVTIPPDAPRNRALWAVLTIWRKKGGDFTRQKVDGNDPQRLDDRQVVLAEFALPDEAKAESPSLLAAFDTGFTLESAELPERAVAGESFAVRFAWRSDEDGREEYIQFLHFVHAATGDWWGYDQQPLGPRLPTRLWYSGLADSETWSVPLPAGLAPGRHAVYTGLYSASDQARASAFDDDGQPWRDGRVLLGEITVES